MAGSGPNFAQTKKVIIETATTIEISSLMTL
jgi:hypothetical protein